MSLHLITAPASEPVEVADVKVHSRVDPSVGPAEDSLLQSFIKAARQYAETFTGRQFVSATWELRLDYFPGCGWLELPLPPLASVTSIKYLDYAGVEQTMSAADYIVSTPSGETCSPGRISLAYAAIWPVSLPVIDAVRVRFVAGYTTVPEGIKAAIRSHVEELYNNRGDSIVGTITAQTQRGVDSALWPFRVWPKVAA